MFIIIGCYDHLLLVIPWAWLYNPMTLQNYFLEIMLFFR